MESESWLRKTKKKKNQRAFILTTLFYSLQKMLTPISLILAGGGEIVEWVSERHNAYVREERRKGREREHE